MRSSMGSEFRRNKTIEHMRGKSTGGALKGRSGLQDEGDANEDDIDGLEVLVGEQQGMP